MRLKQKDFERRCTYVHQYATWRTHPGRKPTWWHTPSRSTARICTTMHINAGRFASFRIHVGRVNKQVCNHGGWTTHSNVVLKPTIQVYLSGHQELIIPSIQVKNSWPNHVNELHNKTLWWPHHHGSGPNTTNLVHPRTTMVESLHGSCKNSSWFMQKLSVGRLTSNIFTRIA